jgi:AraC family ethanolamine operon transcriptional activator
MHAPDASTLSQAAPRFWCDIASSSLGLRTSEAHDADEQADSLTAWEQSYDQLSAGRFSGLLSEWRLPHMQVFREQTSQALRQSCRVWDDSFWFGLPDLLAIGSAQATRINGRLHGRHEIMVRPGGEDFELVTPGGHSLFGIVVQRQALMSAAQSLGCRVAWHQLQQVVVLQVSESALLACLTRLGMLLSAQPNVLPLSPEQLASIERTVMESLIGLIDHGVAEPDPRHCLNRRQKVVAQARSLVMACPDHALTVPELCEQLHVSRRTLQYCFEDVLGHSPIVYLRAVRLNGARRQLRDAARQQQGLGVQDVAARWGFWHMSQFALDYRKLFAESPSDTLRRYAR